MHLIRLPSHYGWVEYFRFDRVFLIDWRLPSTENFNGWYRSLFPTESC